MSNWRNHSINKSIIWAVFFGLTSVVGAAAIGQEVDQKKGGQEKEAVGSQVKRSANPQTRNAVVKKRTPAPLVRQPPVEYLSGEANVQVRGNENPIIRLGLAQNGVTIVEFPAADGIYYLHPGNSDLVTIDDSPSKLVDHFIVFRAGAGFVLTNAASRPSSLPSASIMVQMRSGMIVTFLIYPVQALSENAHRCVVMYNRAEVVSARSAAGLAVNLGGIESAPSSKPPLVVSDSAPTVSSDSTGSGAGTSTVNQIGRGVIAAGSAATVKGTEQTLVGEIDSREADASAKKGRGKKKVSNIQEQANKALLNAVKSPEKAGTWTASIHGLSLVVSRATDVDETLRMVVVGVRNDTKNPLRLVAGSPDLYVETTDEKGKPLQIERVKRVHVEKTLLGGTMGAGQVAYFAIVYEAPELGVKQRLKVSVAQSEAADEPSSVETTPQKR